ncbi:MAG TPA: hypothetical protein VFB51_09780 [Solirubrobacterales bacterium]|nr:hypothetical protein [Solirubrobacterales bacterium]
MSPQPDWTLPNPDAVLDAGEPPLPDTESLLSELGAAYPVVAYPAPQEEGGEERLEEAIYAGLVFP